MTVTELARRLCLDAHPHYGTTGERVPCGAHLGQAQTLWGLTQPRGLQALRVVLAVRREVVGLSLAAEVSKV